MPSLAPLQGWEATGHSLHKAAQIVSALRLLTLPHDPHYLEVSTAIRPEGLSTGQLAFGEVVLNFQKTAFVYTPLTPTTGQSVEIDLTGESQASLLEKLLLAIEQSGYTPAAIQDNGRSESQNPTSAFFATLKAAGLPYTPSREDLTDPSPLQLDKSAATEYARTLYTVFTAAARFRARLTGTLTPIVVWPEHFDLSFLWFPTDQTGDSAPQMNFGFAPYTDGSIPRPYLYTYAYPMPQGFEQYKLPAGAFWNTEGWSGMVFPYDNLIKSDDVEATIETAFREVWKLLAPSLSANPLLPA